MRLLVFVVSAPISALAGWLYAYQRAYVGPDMFETYFLVLMLTAIVLVGRRLLLGPLIGTALIIVQQTFFSIGGDGDKIVLGLGAGRHPAVWPQGSRRPMGRLGRENDAPTTVGRPPPPGIA